MANDPEEADGVIPGAMPITMTTNTTPSPSRVAATRSYNGLLGGTSKGLPATSMRRALALFYDDNAANLKGAGPRGRHPHVLTKRLTSPLSMDDLSKVLTVYEQRAAALPADPSTAVPLFFFDFDGTLTLKDGLLNLAGGHDNLTELFGSYERQRMLQRVLGTLLQTGQVYILTANMAHQRVEIVLNTLLAAGGGGRAPAGSEPARFLADDTVRFVPAGNKLKVLEEIVASRGFALVSK